jgi:hypothetical protein
MLKSQAQTELLGVDSSDIADVVAQEAIVNEFLSKLSKEFTVEVTEYNICITADDSSKLAGLAAEAIAAFEDAYLVELELQSDMIVIDADPVEFTEDNGYIHFDIQDY